MTLGQYVDGWLAEGRITAEEHANISAALAVLGVYSPGDLLRSDVDGVTHETDGRGVVVDVAIVTDVTLTLDLGAPHTTDLEVIGQRDATVQEEPPE